jgi:hypothetical protein
VDADRGGGAPSTDQREASRRRWLAAQTFGELCGLTADFLHRRLEGFPGWGAAEPDEETDAIRARLATLNGAGLLTLASQPGFEGRIDGHAVRQRAFVTGFGDADVARRLLAGGGIEVRAWAPDAATDASVPAVGEPMTLVDGTPRVLAGHPARGEELDLFQDEIGPLAFRALGQATYLAAWDPMFGRTTFLWDELERRLRT